MTYLPDVKVEIAFESGYSTPAADRTWTDVTDWWEASEGYSITRGRQDELSEPSPSTLSLTLDNTDGRFTPGRTTSPYYPNVKVGRPIRVTVTPDGGSASVRFVGYVDEWPVEWDGTDAYAKVTIQATSRTARLGQNASLRSIIEEDVLRHDPVAYFPLSGPEETTQAVDLTGGPALRQAGSGSAVTFGTATGPGTDDLTAATFSGGNRLQNDTMPIDTGGTYSLLMAIVTTATDCSLWGAFLGTGNSLQLRISATGKAEVVRDSVTPALDDSATGTTTVADGLLHTIALTKDDPDGSITLYVDGVDEGIGVVAWDIISDSWMLGAARDSAGTPLTTYTGTMAHVALLDEGLSAADVASFHEACSTGYAGDTPGDRVARYAEYAGIPTVEQSLATGSAAIAHTDTTEKTVTELMQAVADTDGGVLFDARDGTLTYQARDVRYQADAALTLSASAQEVEADFSPKLDRASLLNDVTATNGGGGIIVRALDEDSSDEYGVFSTSLELMTDDESALHGAAWWRVNTRAEPAPRVPSLSVNVLDLDGDRQDALLTLDVSSRVDVTGLPSQAPATEASYFVEGYTETLTDVSYRFTLNVSDATPWLSTWVLDDPARSQLGTTTRLAY